MKNNWIKAKEIIKNGGVIVAPTDTIYGILGSALYKNTVERVYKIRGRDKDKPCIVLVSSFDQINKLGVKISKKEKMFLENFWPGKVSVILSCVENKFKYLHRGKKSIAFRMVGRRNKNLFNLLDKIGPIIAPSANPQSLKPSQNISEAKKYFGKNIDMYINGNIRKSKPSTLVKFKDNKLEVLREGSVKIKK